MDLKGKAIPSPAKFKDDAPNRVKLTNGQQLKKIAGVIAGVASYFAAWRFL
ncbi:hypothetical protein [Pseudomonas putida]|uniref:hypothetical protein n=1 Tax=Pseudomonas TaxID=286 RepID=UPI0018D7DE88|nr:hypothetical protein [Pseudomonas putida]MBH3458300.1 hypothetical protein [Pseudomonas putida]